MDMRIDRLWLIMRLAECEAVYRTGRSQEELALLADIWAQDLEGQDREAVGRAFVLHRQESGRFPCPADILRLLPRCRHAERRQDAAALPVETVAVGPARTATWPACCCRPCAGTTRPGTRCSACGCSRGRGKYGQAEDVQAMPRVRCGCRRGDLHTAAGALPQSLVRMHGLRGPHPLGHGRRARPLGARSRNKVTRNPETLLPLTSRSMLRFRQNPGGVFYVR